MAGKAKPTAKRKPRAKKRPTWWARLRALTWRQLVGRSAAVMGGLVILIVLAFAIIPPPRTPYMVSEGARLGHPVDRIWVSGDNISEHMFRAVVAAEDANFCLHWGFDMAAIRDAISDGGARGASTLTQQTVKNVFLWQGRSWPRKAMEAVLTPLVELIWSKRRIVEVYLNVAEFGDGVFGVEAAARRNFGVGPESLSLRQAALLAATLPNPKERSAANPSGFVSQRASAIADGAQTIAADGRDACLWD